MGRPFKGVDKNGMAFPPGVAAIENGCNGKAGQLFSQFGRIGHCGGIEDKSGGSPVKTADPLQPPEHLGHVGTHDPPVGVDFIHDHQL